MAWSISTRTAKSLVGRRPCGGNGTLARLLAANGFPHVDCYDPPVPQYAQKPPHKYDCIVSFEVFEHSTDPVRIFTELNDLLADPGMVMFSTFLQPENLEQIGLNWWYAAPARLNPERSRFVALCGASLRLIPNVTILMS